LLGLRPRLLVQTGSHETQALIKLELESGPLPILRPAAGEPQSIELPAFRHYASQAAGFARIMAQFPPALKTGVVSSPVLLIVERSLARYPWEALIGVHFTGWLSDPVQFVRPGDPLPRPVQGVREWQRLGVALYTRSVLEPPLRAAWRDLSLSLLSNKDPRDNAYRVLHVVGVAARTPSGPVFTIGRVSETEAPAAVDPAKLPAEAAIVIVQEEPTERIRRLDIDREQTSLTRAWATELFYAGMQNVIFIPALPLALSIKLVEVLASALHPEKPPNLFRLMILVRRLQLRVERFRPERAQEGAPDLRGGLSNVELKAALRELSLEVTLFARSPETLLNGHTTLVAR
jgi:hypothetical protein